MARPRWLRQILAGPQYVVCHADLAEVRWDPTTHPPTSSLRPLADNRWWALTDKPFFTAKAAHSHARLLANMSMRAGTLRDVEVRTLTQLGLTARQGRVPIDLPKEGT